MRSLYLRIYLTVVAALALFALVSGLLVRQHLEGQRERAEAAMRERVQAWAELLERSLPPADAPVEEQAAGLRDWARRLRLPMALHDASGQRIAASDNFLRREAESAQFAARLHPVQLDDGRTLWVPRMSAMRAGRGEPGDGEARRGRDHMADAQGLDRGAFVPRAPMSPPELRPLDPRPPPWLALPRSWPDGLGLAALLVVLFLAVAAGAYPVVRRLTRRLEALKQGVEAFGAGALHQRVAEDGRDEVAAVAASFNQAAARVQALVQSHQSLLANASHELRSPLARLKMALQMLQDAPPGQQAALQREIATNIAELDALVEEVLLAGRLDAAQTQAAAPAALVPLDLLALLAEEAARLDADVQGEPLQVAGELRLLRRAIRNLLENARRYGGGEISAQVVRAPDGRAELRVCDRGPGVPEDLRERIFEPFFRLPGHAEREGGVGLGLSLVRQIATRHGGQVRCEPHAGGGSCFVLSLPLAQAT